MLTDVASSNFVIGAGTRRAVPRSSAHGTTLAHEWLSDLIDGHLSAPTAGAVQLLDCRRRL